MAQTASDAPCFWRSPTLVLGPPNSLDVDRPIAPSQTCGPGNLAVASDVVAQQDVKGSRAMMGRAKHARRNVTR